MLTLQIKVVVRENNIVEFLSRKTLAKATASQVIT